MDIVSRALLCRVEVIKEGYSVGEIEMRCGKNMRIGDEIVPSLDIIGQNHPDCACKSGDLSHFGPSDFAPKAYQYLPFRLLGVKASRLA